MNLKVLMLLLIYYSLLGLIFVSSGSIFTEEGYTSNIDLPDQGLEDGEIDTGGLFGTGISFGRFISLIGFGIGLPSSTPGWFVVIFATWQSVVTIFTIGFVISSIWNG